MGYLILLSLIAVIVIIFIRLHLEIRRASKNKLRVKRVLECEETITLLEKHAPELMREDQVEVTRVFLYSNVPGADEQFFNTTLHNFTKKRKKDKNFPSSMYHKDDVIATVRKIQSRKAH